MQILSGFNTVDFLNIVAILSTFGYLVCLFLNIPFKKYTPDFESSGFFASDKALVNDKKFLLGQRI